MSMSRTVPSNSASPWLWPDMTEEQFLVHLEEIHEDMLEALETPGKKGAPYNATIAKASLSIHDRLKGARNWGLQKGWLVKGTAAHTQIMETFRYLVEFGFGLKPPKDI